MSKYVIVDLEMCRVPKGAERKIFASNCELIEIGAVLLDENYEKTDSFKTYVSPEFGRMDSFIEELTGITKDDIKGAPSAKEALEAFVAWMPEDAIPVSWSNSDEKQIRKEIELKNIVIPGLEDYLDKWEDCQKTFGEKMNNPRSYSLSNALVIADIDYDKNMHDALVDAENTALLFAKMKKESKMKLVSWYKTEEGKTATDTPFAELLINFSFAG